MNFPLVEREGASEVVLTSAGGESCWRSWHGDEHCYGLIVVPPTPAVEADGSYCAATCYGHLGFEDVVQADPVAGDHGEQEDATHSTRSSGDQQQTRWIPFKGFLQYLIDTARSVVGSPTHTHVGRLEKLDDLPSGVYFHHEKASLRESSHG